MAQRGHVPRFGEWNQNGQNSAYTTYFETARKGKAVGTNIVNPNDPEQMAELHRPEPQKPNHDNRGRSSDHITMNQQPQRANNGREEREHGGYSLQPRQGIQRPHADPQYRRGGTQRSSGDPVYHPSPSPVAQGRTANARHGTPGQGQVKQRPATVPKFGEWDAGNPDSAGYTVIFNQVKEDKKASAAAQFPSPPPAHQMQSAMHERYYHQHQHQHRDSFWGGMFACLRPRPSTRY